MRFVHAADLHIDSPLRGLEEYDGAPVERVRHATRAALENLVRLCLDEQAAFLIIAGDLFDHDWRDFNTALFVVHQLQRLDKAGIPVYLVLGNHDSYAGMSRRVPWPRNVTLFDHQHPHSVPVPSHDVVVHGMSFPRREVTDNLVPAYPAPCAGVLNVGVLHTNANGDRAHGSYAPCTVAELAEKGYDYWALGHVHSFAVLNPEPYVVYSGNTQGRHIRETGEKGCAVVTVDGHGISGVELRTTDVLRWFPVTLTLAREDNLDDLYERFRQALCDVQRRSDGRLAAVRLEITGRGAAHRALTRPDSRQEAVARLRSLAGECSDDLWVEKIALHTQPVLDRDRLKQAPDLVGDLLRAFDSLSENDNALSALTEPLKPLAARAGPELALEGVDLDDPAQLRHWLRQAEALLLDYLLEDRP